MQISRPLPSYSSAAPNTVVPGSMHSEALQRLVPGDYPQVENDLALFSQPVLDLLSRDQVRVAVLAPGQTLADAPGLRTLSSTEAAVEQRQANELVGQALKETFSQGIDSYEALEAAGDSVTRQMRHADLDFHLGIALRPFPLESLAEARNIPLPQVEDWKSAFAQLNEGLVSESGDGVEAKYGIVVLPHTYLDGRIVPESRLSNARQITSEYVERSLGLNRSDERMVLLHESFLAKPAPTVGNYRLAVHEVGHALDHSLERLVNFPGFGALHRQTVDALYEADLTKLAALGPGADTERVFTSDRADDDVREYFAEAVEAYLTPAESEGDIFRGGNSKEGLAHKNPALYSYLETIMTTNFPATALTTPPERDLVPPGIPDPDLEVVRIS